MFSFVLQLDLITNLLGTPSLSDVRTCAPGAIRHVMKGAKKQQALATLYSLSPAATHEAVHLMCQMLIFDPVSNVTNILLPGNFMKTFHWGFWKTTVYVCQTFHSMQQCSLSEVILLSKLWSADCIRL